MHTSADFGHLLPDTGRTMLNGRDITGIAPHKICAAGMGRSFQRTNIFPKLTVFENVQADAVGGTMSYGNQKQLELGLALASDPELLLLDEPTAGMSAAETHDAIRLLERIAGERSLTLLFNEHDMEVVFSIAQKIAVLHQGRKIAEGTPSGVRADPEVRRIYLGERP